MTNQSEQELAEKIKTFRFQTVNEEGDDIELDIEDILGDDCAKLAQAILEAGYRKVPELKPLRSNEIAGVCGKFMRPENKKQGLHLLAEMSAQSQLDSIKKQLDQKTLKDKK